MESLKVSIDHLFFDASYTILAPLFFCPSPLFLIKKRPSAELRMVSVDHRLNLLSFNQLNCFDLIALHHFCYIHPAYQVFTKPVILIG
jgi:hypothetical protein